ncbi:hypothetical protein CHGG_09855 [Chaetomium globosum CBS 148.51]|uniref:Uncharacterized protein n=1 Tax=Chaetomium globosum (strain ATCC 6205 / CBS 148.51 / DSM 1962 / NBRC 6347 / NRRL 1970) TaxID=306901 RepID=Q2GQ99_CHAGB|nr:uncharacterized protein CHGG_09855 [Chaetomium globosum CBS 148.51]EAQ83451.1 hypothetical protein CHGG_09855 [Chaetomium globosum CBS 148.51]
MWDSLDDPNKRREIRYGNNIYVLFRALLHCRKFYGQDSLWVAISRGFNTSATIVKVTAEILTEARRAQRAKPSHGSSYPRVLSDPGSLRALPDAFFQDPREEIRQRRQGARKRAPATPLYDPRFDMPARHGGLPSPSTKDESPRETDRQWPPEFGRKRSASPPAASSSKSRRLDHDPRRQHRPEPDRHGALDELPKIQPTRSPPRPTQPRSAVPTRGDERSNNSAAPAREPLPPKRSITVPPKPSVAGQREAAPSAPVKTQSASSLAVTHDDSALKARIASLEKQLAEAEAKSKLSTAPASPAPATAASSSQLGKDMVELKKEMATATGAISTMMESMHYIVDNLSSVQEEISGFTTEQQALKAALPQLSNGTSTATPQPRRPPHPPPNPHHRRQHPPARRHPPQNPSPDPTTRPAPTPTRHQPPPPATSKPSLKAPNRPASNKLSQQLATIQHHQQRETTPHQPHQQTQQPQTLRQAMAAAERDLQHHLNRVQAFYHRGGGVGSGGMGSGAGAGSGGSRAAVERTADLLAVLADGVRAAQAGQAGV